MIVIKSDGKKEEFDKQKIVKVVKAAILTASKSCPEYIAHLVADDVLSEFSDRQSISTTDIHKSVENHLLLAGQHDVAQVYMQARITSSIGKRAIPAEVREKFAEFDKQFPTQLQRFQYLNKTSRWSAELGRREVWSETIARAMKFIRKTSEDKLSKHDYGRIEKSMLNFDALSSMRLLAMAGPAAERNNVGIYNCAFVGVDNPYVFVEALLISMAGCGVGFSVEDKFVSKLPRIGRGFITNLDDEVYGFFSSAANDCLNKDGSVCHVPDSAEGWGQALLIGLCHWFNGGDVEFDFSKLRPAGAILKTKGGTSSGPEPLKRLLAFVREKILSNVGGCLSNVDVYDIMCMIGDCAISGGVRRSAMLCLYDWGDLAMRNAKSGNWFEKTPWRSNANNSEVWPNRNLTQVEIAKLFLAMDEGGSGEPGAFSRRNIVDSLPPRRRDVLSDDALEKLGTNPCGEIILQSCQFCNLSIVRARPDMSFDELVEAVEVATMIGTIQSSATYFPGLRGIWKSNCEQERLLGVDITGQADCGWFSRSTLISLRHAAIQENRRVADILGIGYSTAVTTVKPSGNSSVLLDCSPGMNRRWSPYYIHRVRVSAHGPMIRVLRASNVPLSPENGQTELDATTYVASFPARCPELTKREQTTRVPCAVAQCNEWLKLKMYYTEHNPSCTITYMPEEFLPLVNWIYEHQEKIGGMAFLPALDSSYEQMPREEISRERYEEMLAEFPTIDFAQIYAFENCDTTTSSAELACMAGLCEF